MSAPVIDPTTSIQGWRQFEYFELQMYATNTPTSWAADRVPSGLSFNTTTGKFTGAMTVPGLWAVPVRAINGGGTSADIVIFFACEESAIQPTSGVEVFIDVVSKRITVPNFMPPERKSDVKALLSAKANDDILMLVRFTKAGVVLDLPVASLSLWVKEIEGEGRVAGSGTSDWEQQGAGSATFYYLHVRLNSDALKNALSSYEADDGTWFEALMEIEWTETPIWEACPVTPLRYTTQTARLDIERDLGQSA